MVLIPSWKIVLAPLVTIGCTVEFATTLPFPSDLSGVGWYRIVWRRVMHNTSANTDAVACSLDGQAYRARLAHIQALMDQALMARERSATSVRLRFRLDAGVETRLKELITLEQECCPFLTFELAKHPGEMVLT